jgi:ABC-type branched-subunit amino acid transport system ATPase component
MLEIINVKKYFGGVKAVDEVSFCVPKGKITALIGPNGSGKSTLFNLISGVYSLDSGKIVFDKKDITKLSTDKRAAQGMSRIFQAPKLSKNLTVKENLLLALEENDQKFWKNFLLPNKTKKEHKEKIIQELKKVALSEKINSKASELSFGQKRLVEIVRAIIKPHKLTLLDEPVAGVTPKLKEELAIILKKLQKQKETILLIEHDMNFTLKIAEHIIVLDEGKVIAQGTPKQIQKNKKVLEAYLGE